MGRISIEPPATVHLIGICGTGMGALAGLLTARGFNVTGSDAHAYPPMSTELKSLGIEIMEGYRASNLKHAPDLVVVGNVCRADHPEVVAAQKQGLEFASMPKTVHDLFIQDRRSIVIAGTHGKTTTTALTAYLLEATGRDPSVLVGGVTADFGSGYKLGQGPDFVIEGDEYDSAYFEKVPKFLSYAPAAAAITSVEHDHIDIYPTADAYTDVFHEFVRLIAPGPLAVYAGDAEALGAARGFHARVVTYGVQGDPMPPGTNWVAAHGGDGNFNLRIDGAAMGTWKTVMHGTHNLRNTLAALILSHHAAGIPLDELATALPGFGGIARRQQVVARPRGITLYDDFAHHPTAVKETLRALKRLHLDGRLIAAFEPRSATACRRLHQKQYVEVFDAADLAIIAPVGRDLPVEEMLDTGRLADDLCARGVEAVAVSTIDEVVDLITRRAKPGDGIVLLSNGAFGGIMNMLVGALG